MSDHDLSVFLLGLGVGSLGAIGEIGRGVPASTIEAAAREAIDSAERGLKRETMLDRLLMQRLSDAVTSFVKGGA